MKLLPYLLRNIPLSSGYYDAFIKITKVRTLIKNDFDKIFEQYDIVVGPTAPTTAFDLGDEIDDPLTMYANDLLTTPVNLAGLPGISVPCGQSNGRPIDYNLLVNRSMKRRYIVLHINMKHNSTYMTLMKNYKEWK